MVLVISLDLANGQVGFGSGLRVNIGPSYQLGTFGLDQVFSRLDRPFRVRSGYVALGLVVIHKNIQHYHHVTILLTR